LENAGRIVSKVGKKGKAGVRAMRAAGRFLEEGAGLC
jgi:hypothetical protein